MKKLIFVLLAFTASTSFAMLPPSTMDSDIKTMMNAAGRAVADYGITNYGMTAGKVKISYNYNTRLFTATDLVRNCSFVADTGISFKKLSTGHHWKVKEVKYSNTCL